jgi:hypothetical protein
MRTWGLALLLLSGCTALPAGEETAALGEPSGDYPDYDERVVLYATNRARANPSQEGWASYPAQPPLLWNEKLNESSRAHSIDMRDTPCFQHDSCDGTDIWTRITSYYTTQYQSIGENISAGVPDGVTAVHNWIYEIGAAAGETGHRDNIFSKDFTFMGSGFAAGGKQYTNYWTQDFIGNPVTRTALSDGIHFPKTAASGKSITFGATWYDKAGQAPSAISVVVDGHCHALTLLRGGAGLAAYEAALSFADGCHPYYFLAASSSGKVSSYPDDGSLQVGYGSAGASCALFASSQAPSDCGGGGTVTPTPSPAAHDLGTNDAFTVHPGGTMGQPDLAQAGPMQSGNPDLAQPGDPPARSTIGGGCALTGGARVDAWLLIPLVLCVLAGRRRRRL